MSTHRTIHGVYLGPYRPRELAVTPAMLRLLRGCLEFERSGRGLPRASADHRAVKSCGRRGFLLIWGTSLDGEAYVLTPLGRLAERLATAMGEQAS